MSEPKRYDVGMTTEFNPHGFNHSFPRVYESEQGRYVEYEDYARLKAEVDKLTFRPEHYLDDDGEWVSNIVFYRMQERLKAEVERLTKAGDAMAADLPPYGSVIRWHAAKSRP